MTNTFSFDIVFEKFDIHKTIKLPRGLSVVYGESGSGKSELIYSLLNQPVKASRNFLVAHKEDQKTFSLCFKTQKIKSYVQILIQSYRLVWSAILNLKTMLKLTLSFKE